MVNFVGAGCGAADLITLRGKRLLEEADVVIYAGSLINPELLDYARPGCELHNSAYMTLEQVIEKISEAEGKGKMTVRLHTGDPCLYGAIREQMDCLDRLGIGYALDSDNRCQEHIARRILQPLFQALCLFLTGL